MDESYEKRCENCPIIRGLKEDIEAVEYDTSYLWNAALTAYKDKDKSFMAFVEVAGEKLYLHKYWNKLVEARQDMDTEPLKFQELCAEILYELHLESQDYKHELKETAENCPSPGRFELDLPAARVIVRFCMSPEYSRTDGIEPVFVQRTPKEEGEFTID